MAIGRLSASVLSVTAVLAAIVAGTTIWLLLTDPVSMTAAVNQGTISPLVHQLAQALSDAFRELLRWL